MSDAELEPFVRALRAGLVVACPTETQMGLLADALDAAAVSAVARLKGRPEGAPIGLLVPSLRAAEALVQELPPRARELAERHWPGPLSLVLRARAGLPAELVADGKVALRVPGPSPALALVRAFGGPLTATSANPSGRPPARDAEEIAAMFGDGVAGTVPGAVPGGAPSTLVDASGPELVSLRAGPVDPTRRAGA